MVDSVESLQTLLTKQAYPNRSIGNTNMNEHSSRSHCILSIKVAGFHAAKDAVVMGRLVLIDLAGSERLSKSGVTGAALKAAQCINQSLSALGNVFNALQAKLSHIPYRNSKLTHLLANCLGGQSKVIMFCCLSPSADNYSESLCSLGFASRARSIELGSAKKNSLKATANNKKYIFG